MSKSPILPIDLSYMLFSIFCWFSLLNRLMTADEEPLTDV